MRWNRCGFRCKRTRSKKKNIPSQDGQDADITESEIYCPFVNQSKTVNQEALSSFLLSPLSIHCGSRKNRNGERIYLDKYHSVTTILSQTKPASEHFALKNWAKAQISELGEEKFKEKKKYISRRGTSFHHDVQLFFKSKETPFIQEGAPNAGYWQSIRHVLPDIKNVVAIESGVVHPLLGYAGTLDLIAEYKGALSVIDWKTSAKHKMNLKDCYSYPQQVVAYAGAVNYDMNYPFQVCEGVIVIAYENGDPADVHHMSQQICEAYWLEWLIRIQQYRKKFPELAIVEAIPEGTDSQQEMTQIQNSPATSLGAKSVNSIGIPVARLGTAVKDEDVIEEEELVLSSKEEVDESFNFRFVDAWKQMWKNIFNRIRSRGNTK